MKNSKKIILSTEGIQIGGRLILWVEVREVKVLDAQPLGFMFYKMQQQAITIILKSGEEMHIWVEFYANGSDIRLLIQQAEVILEHGGSFDKLHLPANREQIYTEGDINAETFHYYWRSVFKAINTYMFLGFAIFSIWIFSNTKGVLLYVLPVILLILFILVSLQQHYFMLSDKFLVVKNAWLPYRKLIIPLHDITKVATETLPKQETALVITTTEYKMKRYQAGSLKEEDFKELVAEIEKKISHKKAKTSNTH